MFVILEVVHHVVNAIRDRNPMVVVGFRLCSRVIINSCCVLEEDEDQVDLGLALGAAQL